MHLFLFYFLVTEILLFAFLFYSLTFIDDFFISFSHFSIFTTIIFQI